MTRPSLLPFALAALVGGMVGYCFGWLSHHWLCFKYGHTWKYRSWTGNS